MGKAGRAPKLYDVDGEMLSIEEMAKRANITGMGIRYRLKSGMTPSEAVALGHTKQGAMPMWELNGKPTPLREMAAMAGISIAAVRNRLRAGMTPEQVVAAGRAGGLVPPSDDARATAEP